MTVTKSAGISVDVSQNGSHVLPPGHHIGHPYHHTCYLCGAETAQILVTEMQDLWYVYLYHNTCNNVCYNCTRLTGILGSRALDQCARLLYLYQTSSTSIIPPGSVEIFTIMHV